MRFGLTWKVALLVALPGAGALLGLVSFAKHESDQALVASTMNVAGRQRLLASELGAWTSMVADGQDGDRAGLEARITQFDAGVQALRWGGQLDARSVAPPSSDVLIELERLESSWRQEWRPRLQAVASGADATRAAAVWLASHDGALVRESDAVVEALEASAAAANVRQLWLFAATLLADVLLLIVAMWLTYRRIVRPLRDLALAARRAQAGDYSGRLRVDGEDEVSDLGAAFNDASREIGRLVSEERRYRDILEQFGDGVVMVGVDGRITWANGAAERLAGRGPGALLAQAFPDLLLEPQATVVRAELKAFHEGRPTSSARIIRAEVLQPDGGAAPTELSLTPHGVGGELIATFLLRDTSERERLAARMMQVDRMIAVGTLAAGVAHELNNPLAYVVANLGYVAEELPRFRCAGGCDADGDLHGVRACAASIDAMTESIHEAQHGATRMRHIIADLKNFSRTDVEQRRRFEAGNILESSIRMAWNEIRHRARLTKDLEPGLLIEANEARIGQVFLNLLINAAHAIPEGAAERNEIHLAARSEGGSVVVTIRDTGAGIPADILPRIFDPFFTTKPVGQGTGLGLAICSATVHAHGGTITVESGVGQGTTFRVTLPAAQRDAAEDEVVEAPNAALASARRGRVLVVDDEAMITSVLRRMLGPEHEIECANGGLEAIRLLRGGGLFDVILTDLMMPEFDGIDLYEAVAREWPGEEHRLVFMSGGAFTPRAQNFFRTVENLRVEKPFDPEAVRMLVRERVHQRAPPGRGVEAHPA